MSVASSYTSFARWFFWLCLACLWIPGIAAAEWIDEFHATYNLTADGNVQVTEDIIYNFDSRSRRGIIRTLDQTPATPATAWYLIRSAPITVHSVTRNGRSEPFQITKTESTIEIRIGDPTDSLTGRQRYSIRYVIQGAFEQSETGAELYWNVTGHDWRVPIRSVRVRVQAPPGSLGTQRACYQGVVGARVACDVQVIDDERVLFTATAVTPGQGVTIAHAVNPEVIYTGAHTKLAWWVVIVPLFLLIGALWAWRVFSILFAYRPQRAIVTEYEPYQNLPALLLGTLFNGKLDNRDITAGLMQLAQAGHISIAVQPKDGLFDAADYCFRLNTSQYDMPHGYDFHLLTLIFGNRGVGSEVWLSDLRRDKAQQSKNAASIWMLKKELRRELLLRGYYELTPPTLSIVSLYVVVTGIPIALVLWLLLPTDIEAAFYAAIFVFVLMTGWFAQYIGYRRTKAGYEARWHLLGFKRYLQVAEAERMTFHNAPSKNPQEFLEWLPYAIAFGVEQEWSTVFTDVTVPSVGWYNTTDGTALSVSAFTLTSRGLVGGIHSWNQKTQQNAAVGIGHVGSSGRGFSGGGGGGGGGRSW